LNDFADHREDRWDNIHDFREDRWDHWQDRGDDWRKWREDVWDFRADRADEIRDSYRDSYCQWFTPGWYAGCAWWPHVSVNVNPWWWWRPVTYASYEVIYQSPPPPPVTDDYGTDIVIKADDVYIEGKKAGSATDYRQQAIALANPATQPPPPVPADDNDKTIIPLGVWALVQQEKGDAVMFYQLTATKDGLITGTYSNVLTGDNAPVTGSIDKKTQRLAFHTGDKAGNAIEANLNGMTKDQVAVFVHFGTGQTQEWLLVRMPNPDMPTAPAPVKPVNTPAPKK